MRFLSKAAIVLTCLLPVAMAQTQAPSFDDLARRAGALVDSNPAEAVNLLKQALDLRPSWAEGWFLLGGDLSQLGRFAEARDAFRKAIALDANKGVTWGFLGLSEFELGEYDQALADIRKGEALGLGNNREFEAAVRVRAALILIRATAFDEAAVAQLRPLVLMQVDTPEVIEALGLCALVIPRLPTELSASQRAVVSLAGKAFWANMGKHAPEAEAAFRELLRRFPQEPGVHYAYGLYLMDYDQTGSLAEFQKELQRDPNHWPSVLFAALLELRRGDAETSALLIRRAMKVVPERHMSICHAELGNALLAQGHVEQAIPELEAASKLQPRNSQLHFYLQKAYRLAGRKADAEREGAEFLRLKAQEDPLAMPVLPGSPTGSAP